MLRHAPKGIIDVRERRVGILAGGGELPREIADELARAGLLVAVVAIEGEADADFGTHPVTRVNWGQIGAMIRTLKQARANELVIVGRVHRPELGILRPDLGFFRYLPQIVKIVASGGDDSVLRRVVRFFEQHGIAIIGPGEAAPSLVVGAGPIGKAASSDNDQADIRKGFELVRALGAYDIGQSVIVSGGKIEAIEGAEGTDRMIARAAATRGATEPRTGVLVKRSKPGQDLRVDMPAIGPATVQGVLAAGLDGIAVEAGKVVVAERARTLTAADAAGLFVEGVEDQHNEALTHRFNARKVAMKFRCLTRAAPEQHAIHDAIKGLAAVDALAAFGVGRAAVVVRNHVLSVETGEGPEAVIARAAGLRQWASLTRRRRGVAVLRDTSDLTKPVVEAVAVSGYAGVAVARDADAIPAEIAAVAERSGLFIVIRDQGNGAAS
jgi:DUF1009 family protein